MQIVFESAQIEQAVAGEIEQQHFLFPALAAINCLVHHGSDGVGRFRRGHEAFAAGKQGGGLKDLGLMVGLGLDEPELSAWLTMGDMPW